MYDCKELRIIIQTATFNEVSMYFNLTMVLNEAHVDCVTTHLSVGVPL